MNNRRKAPREKDLTSRFMSGNYDEDRAQSSQRFSARNKGAEQSKILKTALLRAEEDSAPDVELLPIGEVVQVFSIYYEVLHGDQTYLCVLRKTLSKILDTALVVGDRVRFRAIDVTEDERAALGGRPEAVIEQLIPRKTLLTRSDSFRGTGQHPIVSNAEQMLIVASIRLPNIKWGLIDRMIIAAKAGGLRAIICLNKIDVVEEADGAQDSVPEDLAEAREILAHYKTLDVESLETSVVTSRGLDALRKLLQGHSTVLAGHSGVGKSSLIRAIQPSLDLRIGDISGYTNKGRHTTTSARRYDLDAGGTVIDTPGVKMFGLWGVSQENLDEFFPDVEAKTAPDWREESYKRIRESLKKE